MTVLDLLLAVLSPPMEAHGGQIGRIRIGRAVFRGLGSGGRSNGAGVSRRGWNGLYRSHISCIGRPKRTRRRKMHYGCSPESRRVSRSDQRAKITWQRISVRAVGILVSLHVPRLFAPDAILVGALRVRSRRFRLVRELLRFESQRRRAPPVIWRGADVPE